MPEGVTVRQGLIGLSGTPTQSIVEFCKVLYLNPKPNRSWSSARYCTYGEGPPRRAGRELRDRAVRSHAHARGPHRAADTKLTLGRGNPRGLAVTCCIGILMISSVLRNLILFVLRLLFYGAAVDPVGVGKCRASSR